MTMKIRIKKLNESAQVPSYATDGSACFDLYACVDTMLPIYEGVPVEVATGLSFEIPKGYVMLIFSRSGHAFKHDVRLSNCVGVIDSDYRGEVKVRLTRDQSFSTSMKVAQGDRIAQALLVPYPEVSFVEAENLTETERGFGGFGSTG